jgi:hypothetical protein
VLRWTLADFIENYCFVCDFVATKPWAAAIVKEVEVGAIADDMPSHFSERIS